MGEETCHPATRAMLAYSRAMARNVEPPRLVGADGAADRLLVLELQGGVCRISAFGDGLLALFGRDLRGRDLLDMFAPADAGLLRALLAATCEAELPGVARARAHTGADAQFGVEILVTPLRAMTAGREGAGRHLGMIQPLGGETLAAGASIARLTLGAVFPPEARVRPAFGPRLIVSND